MKIKFLILALVFATTISACGKEDKPIQKSQLPKNSQEFVDQHFADLQIAHIIKDYDSYDVKFTNGYDVEFNKKGEWKEVDCELDAVPAAIIPTNIADYVKTNFATSFIVRISKEYNHYDVELSTDLDLEFNLDGTYRRID